MPKKLHFFCRCVILIQITIVIVSCNSKEKTIQQLQGHWHAVEPFHFTMDIEDSVIYLNRYSMIEVFEQYALFDAEGSVSLPFIWHAVSILPAKFKVTKDSLIYWHSKEYEDEFSEPPRFARHDLDQCKSRHAFEGPINVIRIKDLPQATMPVIPFDILNKKYGFET